MCPDEVHPYDYLLAAFRVALRVDAVPSVAFAPGIPLAVQIAKAVADAEVANYCRDEIRDWLLCNETEFLDLALDAGLNPLTTRRMAEELDDNNWLPLAEPLEICDTRMGEFA